MPSTHIHLSPHTHTYTDLISNHEGSAKAVGIRLALLLDVNMLKHCILHLPREGEVVWALMERRGRRGRKRSSRWGREEGGEEARGRGEAKRGRGEAGRGRGEARRGRGEEGGEEGRREGGGQNDCMDPELK